MTEANSTIFCHPEPPAKDLLLIDSTAATVEDFLSSLCFARWRERVTFLFL
jgi:hypothetical protein